MDQTVLRGLVEQLKLRACSSRGGPTVSLALSEVATAVSEAAMALAEQTLDTPPARIWPTKGRDAANVSLLEFLDKNSARYTRAREAAERIRALTVETTQLRGELHDMQRELALARQDRAKLLNAQLQIEFQRLWFVFDRNKRPVWWGKTSEEASMVQLQEGDQVVCCDLYPAGL